MPRRTPLRPAGVARRLFRASRRVALASVLLAAGFAAFAGASAAQATNTSCVAEDPNCTVAFPAPDASGLQDLLVADVYAGFPCADPTVCDVPSGDILDAVVVVLVSGPTGIANAAAELANFSLALPDGSDATPDALSCDMNLPYNLCSTAAVPANTAFGAVLFFDAPATESWSEVQFSYSTAGAPPVIWGFSPD